MSFQCVVWCSYIEYICSKCDFKRFLAPLCSAGNVCLHCLLPLSVLRLKIFSNFYEKILCRFPCVQSIIKDKEQNFNWDFDQFELTFFHKETIKKCQLCKRMASKLIYCCCLQTLDTNYCYRAESMSPLLLSWTSSFAF